MGRGALRGALAVVAALAAADARAAGEAPVPPHVDIDALVALLAAGPDDPVADGPSPTARVARLVAAGDAKLRPVLADAWRIATTVPAATHRRDGVRRLVRFLYDLGLPDAPGPWLVEADGAVRVRRALGDAPESPEAIAARDATDVAVPFELEVGAARLRAAPRPDAKRLLALLDTGGVPEDERDAVAQALGEQCAATTALVRELVRRVEAEGSAPWKATALAWTRRSEAEPPLRARVGRLARAGSDGAAAASLASACRALAHAAPAALDEEVAALEADAREAALSVAGLDVATRVDLASLAAAKDAPARERIVADACRRIVARRGDLHVSGATLSSLAPLLAQHRDDGDALARAVLADAARRLYWPAGPAPRPPAGAEDLGPYPSAGVRLAALAEDMKDGALVFTDGRASLFEFVTAPPRREARPLRTAAGVRSSSEQAGGAEPFRLTGEVIGPVLRLTLKNEGTVPRFVDRVALRHGVATLVREDGYAGPDARRGVRLLGITLGVLRAAATPANRLVTILPGEAYSWAVELRAEDRDVDQITVALADTIAVRGDVAGTRLERFAPTRVK
jgi:hypothetical protein